MAGSLAFLTVRDHLIVIGLSFLFFVAVNVSLVPLSINWLPIAVIAPPCLIAIAGNVLKVILHRRQFETGKALEYQKQTLQETLESVRSIKEQMVQQSQVALMGKMTSGLAHEINNPLAIAMGVVDSLRTGKVPTENADPYLRKVETALGRIRSIVSEMRLVSSSYDNETLQRVPLGEIVNTLRLIVNPIAIKNKVLLTIIEPPDVFLMCYKSKLTMALVNVLVNGVDFTPKAVEESWVLMTFEISGEKLFIDVTDSGQIDPTKAMMIFLPFYTTKEVSQGIGLGLSTARGVFETHKGSIELVPDRPNTTFRITLNIAV